MFFHFTTDALCFITAAQLSPKGFPDKGEVTVVPYKEKLCLWIPFRTRWQIHKMGQVREAVGQDGIGSLILKGCFLRLKCARHCLGRLVCASLLIFHLDPALI